jgi:uncharacterized RDD family membrane protein YckC
MYCIKCGKENGEKAKICYYCGALLYRPGEEPKTATPVLAESEIAEKPGETAEKIPQTTPSFTPYQPKPDPFQDRTPFNSNAPFRSPFASFNQENIFDNPYLFYAYKNKENQKIYAAYAPFAIRIGAAFLDTLVLSFPLFLLTYLYSLSLTAQQQYELLNSTGTYALPNWITLSWYTLYLLYCVYFTARRGQTLGKIVFGIKIITKEGAKPDFNTALIRNLFGFSFGLSSVLINTNTVFVVVGFLLQTVVMLGFAFAGMDLKRQGWHDKIAGTLVVRKREYTRQGAEVKGQGSEKTG